MNQPTVLTQHSYTVESDRILTIQLNQEGELYSVISEYRTFDGIVLDSEVLFSTYSGSMAVDVYNAKTGMNVFLPDSSESGQAIILYIIAIVCIALVLYMVYTAISMLSGSEGGLFELLISGLEEVIQ